MSLLSACGIKTKLRANPISPEETNCVVKAQGTVRRINTNARDYKGIDYWGWLWCDYSRSFTGGISISGFVQPRLFSPGNTGINDLWELELRRPRSEGRRYYPLQ